MSEHPNVVVMFCDQLRMDLLGCYGSELVRTPHLDALAADGIAFDRAYTPTAICSPARASLLTGLYPQNHHMYTNSTPGYSYCHHLRPEVRTLADWATATDYETSYCGKWHIGPAQDLFDSQFDHTHPRPHEGAPSYLSSSHWHPNTKLGEWTNRVGEHPASGTIQMALEDYPDVAARRYTVDFLDNRDSDRPFLAFCAFPGPHSPWLVPDEWGIRYEPDEIPIWPNRHDDFAGKPLNQRRLRIYDQHGGIRDEETLRASLACCFSYLELIDRQVGELVADLKRRGIYDDTCIFFTADHGDMAGSHGMTSKGAYMYDEIYRIPLIAKPAGPFQPGRRSELVHLMDVTATVAHLMAGEPVEDLGSLPLDGQSLLPMISGETQWDRPVHFAEYHGDWYGHYSSRMVTDGRWKLVYNLGDIGELYDLENDPHELCNLYYDVACAEVRDRYLGLLREQAARLGDGQVRMARPEIEKELAGVAAGLGPLDFVVSAPH